MFEIAMWVCLASLGYTVAKLQERVKFLERQLHISPGDPSER